MKSTVVIKKIAFFGDGVAKPSQAHYRHAYKIAALLAASGYTVINGGGPGVMLASTLGAKSVGGRVEVVVIRPKNAPGNYEGSDPKNLSLADRQYSSSTYSARLNKLLQVADAYVIFKGGTGTLSEVGLAWELAKFNYGRHKPLIFYGPQWRKIITEIKKDLDFESIEKNVAFVANSPDQILKYLGFFNS